MSLKFEAPLYKVYEPGFHTQQPIIVDEDIGSPDALDIRLQAEAAHGDGGGLRRVESPIGLPHMSAYKAQAPSIQGFPESPYSQYSSQSFSTQQTENAAASINQMAFAANSATSQYMSAPPNMGASVSVVSCHPSSGAFGTKVFLKIASQYDLLAMAAPTPYFSVVFGAHRIAGQVVKDPQESNGSYSYTVTVEAPQPLQTGCPNLTNVPLTLLVDSPDGEEIARVPEAAIFSYHGAHGGATGGGVGVGGSGDTSTHEPMGTRRDPPEQRGSPPHTLQVRDNSGGSPSPTHGLPSDSNTNTYAYPAAVGAVGVAAEPQADPQAQANFAVAASSAYNQGDNNMLGTYRSTAYAEHYHRAPQALRSPHSLRSPHAAGWSAYGSHMDSLRSPSSSLPHATHTAISRPSLNPLPHPNNAPQLVRTTTLTQSGGSGNGNYNPFAGLPAKATLRIHGNLDTMTEGWTQEEWENKRRIVQFKRNLQGNQLSTSFRALTASEQPQNSICVSCIWWEEKSECFVTSVDTINLLEQLVVYPARFTVEEKNRIRRNLEGFHPLTISKAKPDTEEFFKLIMSFGNPKPRRIEKDVKVFQWKILGSALKKIISKYSASPSSTIPTNTLTHPLTPVSMSGSYGNLPPMPRGSISSADSGGLGGYDNPPHHHHTESSSSSRSLSGGASSWGSYATPAKPMSPGLKMASPTTSSALRIPALPAVYDNRPSTHSLTSPYAIPTPAHHTSHHQSSYNHSSIPGPPGHGRSWDAYSVGDAYTNTSAHAHGSVYGPGPYGEGAQRA
ncbi:hypothetical protein GQ53DRAFT_883670 [Thozetella sp. PMI_491]|nr:hypothetical protein GQ53DRAFT_883670 [Thozetella sp. PMI_491]